MKSPATPVLSGFTLLEMMIVLIILIIILAMSIYSLKGVREHIHTQACCGNLQMLHTAVNIFAIEHHLARGASVHITNLYPRFFRKSTPGVCPASGVAYTSIYVYGTVPACPSVALYTNHVWSPTQSLGL